MASAGRSLFSELRWVCVTAWPDSAVSVLCCGFCWGSVCLWGMFPVYRGGGAGLGASFFALTCRNILWVCVWGRVLE